MLPPVLRAVAATAATNVTEFPEAQAEIAALASSVSSILATRYLSAVAVSVLLYDHVLTFDDEIAVIWRNNGAALIDRFIFIFNRYLSEGIMIYVAYMLSGNSSPDLVTRVCQIFVFLWAISSTIFVTISHFAIISRVYRLWDRRKEIKWILFGSFAIAMILLTTFVALAASQVKPLLFYNHFIIYGCSFSKKPHALPFMVGTLTIFDLFIIIMTILNAYNRPYQKQAEVVTALQRDGALMFVALFLIRLTGLMMAIFGDPTNCFVILSLVWAMCAIANSRMQLRIEGLRFIRYTSQDMVIRM
uniref:DUF6533 domain-containing protein n=1 Tax=Mycena chlorophos TaxID=658473 RepID=A0ABQ0L246_MYCCL|nr:predicted protein [Mycena chlorophos]